MQVAMQVERPEDVRVKLETTMTVAQWNRLAESLTAALNQQGGWHSDVSAFRNAIVSGMDKIAQTVKGQSVVLVQE
jgi:hypothetical protein